MLELRHASKSGPTWGHTALQALPPTASQPSILQPTS